MRFDQFACRERSRADVSGFLDLAKILSGERFQINSHMLITIRRVILHTRVAEWLPAAVVGAELRERLLVCGAETTHRRRECDRYVVLLRLQSVRRSETGVTNRTQIRTPIALHRRFCIFTAVAHSGARARL